MAQLFFVASLLAQTNAVPGGALPQTTGQFWDLIIAAVTPVIVFGVSKVIPALPRAFLPAITPVLGILLGLLVNKLAGANLSWIDMAKAGALAVFVREVVNQTITKRLAESDATK